MINNQAEDIQSELEKNATKRQKKKKPNMKISGRQVKNLQRLIIEKKSERVSNKS